MDLKEAVETSKSFRDVGKLLGVNHKEAKRLVIEAGLSTDHFWSGDGYLKLAGRTFNEITVLSVFKDGKKWMCSGLCSCGVEFQRKRLDAVVSGKIVSCGCVGKLRLASSTKSSNASWKGSGELGSVRFNDIKANAKKRKIEFDLTIEFLGALFTKQRGRCALSGMEITFGRTRVYHESTASLDRKDSSKPYVETNVQWVHKDVNKIKQSLDQEQFIDLCKRIAAHNSV